MSGDHERHMVCRVCNKGCPMIAEVRDGRLTSLRGDKSNPLFQGYTCVKGRAMTEFLYHPQRLLRSLRRTAGGVEPVPIQEAMDEVAQQLAVIIADHGPRAVATYTGTQMQNVPVGAVIKAFAQAIGTSMNFAALTVDKPGRPIAWAMLGKWQAPPQNFTDPDVAMLLGINPLVNGLGGVPAGHPGAWLSERLRAGMELIVVDPRRSDIAKRATVFLQPKPGHDIPILAAMLNVIIREGLYDAAFVREDVRNLDLLRRTVSGFRPADVAERAGLAAGEIELAARVFARAGRGYAVAGTGPHFAGLGTLLEYLTLCLDTVCGHWMREGEIVPHIGVLSRATMPRAQASNPGGAYGFGERSRLRGLGMTAAGMPSATLAEEILTPGPGRVRALLSCGGNPVAALPEHRQTVEALERLDLLVQVDPWMSQTARYADFVIAPTMTPEMIGTTQKIEGSAGTYATGYGFPADYAQYCDAVVEPPAGSDVIEDWLFFYGVAQRLGLELTVTTLEGERVPLDMVDPPDPADLVAVLNHGSRVPLDEIKRHPGGAFFPSDPPVRVAPKEPGWAGRLDVGNAALMADLTDLAGRAEGWPPVADRFPFRLLNRRMAHVVNSSYNARVAAGHPGPNHAYLCSADFAELTITAGEEIEIESPYGSVRAVAAVDDGLRRGTVSMPFGFGDGTENDEHIRVVGSSVARLLSTRDGYDPYSGQPRMSALPVRIGSIPGSGAMPTSVTATPEA